jgi:hypothetical protein
MFTMDFLHTLLKFFASLVTLSVMGVQSFLGFSHEQPKVTILPPTLSNQHSATSSSQTLIGTSTQPPSNVRTASPTIASSTKKILKKTPISTPTIPATPPPPASTIDEVDLNAQTRKALVNILCTTGPSGSVHPISASGVFIDSRGVILTNAHVGQFFLLRDYPTPGNVDCVVRVGEPAQPKYRATLLYLPQSWVAENANQLIAEQALGTGENDYAFLIITGSTGPDPLPSTFPYLPITNAEPSLGDYDLLAAYSAGFLGGITIEKSLYIASAYTYVRELFTYTTSAHIDLVSIGGTVVSQAGSSGGAMVRARDGRLQGIITTETIASTTAQRDLRAITIAHINRSLAEGGQGGLVSLLEGDAAQKAAQFAANIAPGEKALLIKVLERH